MEKVGFLKINRILIFYMTITFCFLLSCKKESINKEAVIADNFIQLVDTFAYKTGTFIPVPFIEEEKFDSNKKQIIPKVPFSVNLVDSIVYDKIISRDINDLFSKNSKLDKLYGEILRKGKYENFQLTSHFPKSIGKYNIYTDSSIEKPNFVGEIELCNFKMYENKIMLVLIKSVGHSKRADLIIFKKTNNLWKIIDRANLFVS
ncbi:hypothetical protein [Flavobacterium gelatinilyticum]|uniref:hypothetical protein n=1 Tax=Flavobacterium gelatinilyticum TaxID=3003260 RepID=UPI002481162C|nr:hypothetical protein [Flavobacterium gelatinilyticum]